MTEKRTSIFENGLIWFGAGVSLAEILTGTYFASLGFGKGLLAIIIGHIIGCTMQTLTMPFIMWSQSTRTTRFIRLGEI